MIPVGFFYFFGFDDLSAVRAKAELDGVAPSGQGRFAWGRLFVTIQLAK